MLRIWLKPILAAALTLGMVQIAAGADDEPYLFVLGVAQDAGHPQSGCYAPHCMPGWRDPRLRRGAVSLGLIDPGTDEKFLFEATPDFPAQLYDLEREAPSDRFRLAGIFLTHAHIGHYAGLMFLGHEAMGAAEIPVYAMPKMMAYLRDNGPWSQLVAYRNIVLEPLREKTAVSLGRISVTPFRVPHRDEYSETVGFRIAGPEKTAVFIPDIDKWSVWDTDLANLVRSVDYALIDATFFADGELPGRDMSKVRHPFVTESMDELEQLSRAERGRVWFIHFNHTNPLFDKDSDQYRIVRSSGFNIAFEGTRLGL